MGLIVFIVIVGIAAAGYFFVYPYFAGSEETPATAAPETAVPAPSETLPTETPETTPAEPEVTTPEEPAVTLPPEPVLGAHVSPFKQVPDLKSEVSIADLSVTGLRAVLQFESVQTPVFREIVVKNSSDALLTTRGLLSILAPQTFTSTTLNSFTLDPTLFVYTNSAGSWPGLVLTLADGAVLEDAKAQIGAIETGTEAMNFFATDPGTQGTWANGKAGTLSYRYAPFPSGARFHYIWLGNSLLISTSYDGLKAALNRL